MSAARKETVRPRAVIISPDGVEREVSFRCAGCGRNFIWTIEDDGKCPNCYHDQFKIILTVEQHENKKQ